MNAVAVKAKVKSGDELSPAAAASAGTTVLVVEDYDEVRFVICLSLKMSGYRVIEAVNGEEAIELARIERPDLILMDLNLPLVDGFTATRRIREQLELRDVLIVALTAHGTPEYRHKALAAGCNEFITKPLNLDHLERTLRSLLAHHETAS